VRTAVGGRRRLFARASRVVVGWTAGVSIALLTTTPGPAYAQEHITLPPVNLGGSSFMDGLGGPGLLVREQLGAYGAGRFADASGNTVPGTNTVSAFAAVTLVGYMLPFKVLGGNWGVEALVPWVDAHVRTSGGGADATGAGDLTFSPLVWEAPPLLLAGRQFYQRLDLDIVAPTGQYTRDAAVTAGSHVWSINPYYAFTWLITQRIETSWRLHYLWSSTNNAPSPAYEATTVQPGQAVHLNGAASVAVVPWFRVGLAGYFLRQITDSQASGHAVSGSQEQVAAIGPGIFASAGTLLLTANGYGEFAVENRPQGIRGNVVVMKVW
jgi:hypothetical protein